MIKNVTMGKQILEMIDTLIESAEYLKCCAKKLDYIMFENIVNDMTEMIESIYRATLPIARDDKTITINSECENVIYSLSNILKFSYSRSEKVLVKIEFELIPFLQNMYLQFYFWGFIYTDKNRMNNYYKTEMIPMSVNKYIDKSEKEERYKYDLSVLICAYNKLEYTKLCVENLLKYIPKNINYELILINHGSTDGTKEYFESIAPTKQIDILRNGVTSYSALRIIEGKYMLSISNDVIVTENSISNMIKCMDSDETISWIVPTTPNISNLQTIDGDYTSIEEMHKFASKNNICNPYRWERRTRLCNPIDLQRSKVFYSSKGIGWGGYFHTSNMISFPDDKISLLLRRNGYKLILAKDSYCYHFGSVTIKEDTSNYIDENKIKGNKGFYEEGRKDFCEAFGIDPWGIGFCWDYNLIKNLKCNETGHVDILGINCGFGSNTLKIKEKIKENAHNLDVDIYNVTSDKRYLKDLKSISNHAEYADSVESIKKLYNRKFQYIIFESNFEGYNNPMEIIHELKCFTNQDGIIAIKIENKSLLEKIKSEHFELIEINKWIIIKNNF